MRNAYPLLIEKSVKGMRGADLPKPDVPTYALPESVLAQSAPKLPELSELEVTRHYSALARRNFGVDNGFYPLGSCTMKYNPRMNEALSAMFANVHPLSDEQGAQGTLKLMYELSEQLAEITGMDAVTLQGAAGAHGELCGLMLIKAYHASRGENRTTILVPDAAHGTNPASATMAGFKTKEIPSKPDGSVDVGALRALASGDIAGLMLTNPSTIGLFEENILEIEEIIHGCGGLLYYDGANLNAVMGVARPGDMGFDVVHLNLHKTFSTPHGGGGPGSGPVGVKQALAPFLPNPRVIKTDEGYAFKNEAASIGKIKAFYGNFGVFAKAYAYILSLGAEGIREAAVGAVLNANYMLAKLKDAYKAPYPGPCMHEFVLEGALSNGITASDIAKALIDRGFHPPTIYFPLIVHEALMFEPTETESKSTLDAFIGAMLEIAETAKNDPDALRAAPITTPVGRPDQTQAARKPLVKWL